MPKPNSHETNPADSEFESIVAPIKDEVMGGIIDGAIESTNAFEGLNKELKGIDRVVHEISTLGEGDTEVSLWGSAHGGEVHVQLVPQPLEDVFGSSNDAAVRANPRRAIHINFMDDATLKRKNERVQGVRGRIADLYDKAVNLATDFGEVSGVRVEERLVDGTSLGKRIKIYLDEAKVDGERPYIAVSRYNFDNKEDRSKDTFTIRIEPEASINHKNSIAGKRPYDIRLGKEGDAAYTVSMPAQQLYVAKGESGDIVGWTSDEILGFLDHDVMNRLEVYIKNTETE